MKIFLFRQKLRIALIHINVESNEHQLRTISVQDETVS